MAKTTTTTRESFLPTFKDLVLWGGIGLGFYLLIKKVGSTLPDLSKIDWSKGPIERVIDAALETKIRMAKEEIAFYNRLVETGEYQKAWTGMVKQIELMAHVPLATWVEIIKTWRKDGWLTNAGTFEGTMTCLVRQKISSAEPCANGAKFLLKTLTTSLQTAIAEEEAVTGKTYGSASEVFSKIVSAAG